MFKNTMKALRRLAMERPTSEIAENFIRKFKMKEKAFQDMLYKAI